MCRSAMLHYFRVVVVDDDLTAPGSTFNDNERARAHADLFEFASLVQQVGCSLCHTVSCRHTYCMCMPHATCTTVYIP